MEAYTGGISTRKVDALVEALGGASGISKSEVGRICQGHRCAGESFSGPAFGPRPLPVHLPRRHLPLSARDYVLAHSCGEDFVYLDFPQEHWRKIWSTNPLERLNVAPRGALDSAVIKRRTNVVGTIPNDAAIVRLVGSQLLEQQEEWQLERRRFFSEATMAKIPEPGGALELTVANASA